jgi:hypothetical protein
MPGRPRLYTDDAQRQREYRARQREQQERQQDAHDRLRASVRELHAALKSAAAAGDPVAREALQLGLNETLLNLAAHYRQQAATLNATLTDERKPEA